MSNKPILVLQMQRMGDLILSYPLMLWLQREYPGHPVWVMAEESFYSNLVPVSPGGVTYFPWTEESLAHLRAHDFHFVLNLSHDPRAAQLTGAVKAEAVYGAAQNADGVQYVHGDWQLYRTSLVRSNRHNRYHWADLNALDVIPLSSIAATQWPPARAITPDARRKVGVFIGASEETKRPEPQFWIDLCNELIRRDLRPVLLGGPAEVDMARAVVAGVPASVPDFTGKLKLSEFAYAGQTLGMMITPDTGPMHLAAWSGLRTLNLSMGNVNCWETGPYQPRHFVLRANMSCSGCWECFRPGIPCRDQFLPRQVAYIADHIVREDMGRFHQRPVHGMELYRSWRSPDGLYNLERLAAPVAPSLRYLLGEFWCSWFGARFGLWEADRSRKVMANIGEQYPQFRSSMQRSFVKLARDMGRSLANPSAGISRDFWERTPPALQPVRSFFQLKLENANLSKTAWAECLRMVEELVAITAY